ncbi:uncharacterized protein LOC126736231 [Anthonomus grandis grandis]|uniref:uncharacterized protein LOC126736231 n=1 Tax=Anthonomus grandis grandis TaxID=2921223 RepID=UPI00216663DB|nr:uncharacterized protein LOC126736231 [Anthonomus grandis grandis]
MKKLILSSFLFGIVVSEWVEITRVGSMKDKDTVDPVEITLGRPQFYDATTQNSEEVELQSEGDYYEETLERSVEDDSREEEDNSEGEQALPEQSITMSVFRHIQDQLLDFKGRTFDAKVDHLKKLRDTILYEIKHRISKLFKPFNDPSSARTLYKDDGEHHIDYPSHEGALMTIGFLTFAVFLIKLVLKLIYTLKMKQQFYQTTTTTTPVSIFLREEETARILKSIEEYPLT